jgi:hypothetical protein
MSDEWRPRPPLAWAYQSALDYMQGQVPRKPKPRVVKPKK